MKKTPSPSCRHAVAALAFTCVAAKVHAQGQWNTVWTEPFAGTQLNAGSWNVLDIAWPHNGEAQYYHPSAVTVAGGTMTITSTNVPRGGRSYTSGRLDTSNKQEFLFGKFEMRAKLPRTQGLWPAFWLLPGSDIWPPEIDIMELLGHQPSRTYASNHWGPTAGPQHQTTPWDGPDFSSSYNIFACEWWPDRVDFFVNGNLIGTHREQIPQEAMYIILNTAVGGFWPGYPDATTVFPQRFDVDFVRVSQWSEPLLLNTGFETSPANDTSSLVGWNRWGNTTRNTQLARQGPAALKMYGNFNTPNNTSGVYQDMNAAPGQSWTVTGMVRSPNWDRIGNGNQSRIALEFRSATDQLISQVQSPTFTRTDAADQWHQRTVTGVTPAGTTKVRVVITHTQGAQLAAGAVWWDDISLTRSALCDSIDFNNDTSVYDPQDIDAFLSVYGEGPCIPAAATCNDIDFNNDGSLFDPVDIDTFLRVFAEGPCRL
ncbi:MAG: glycoside hydrolase family 16 protein [Phycisphaerales bacterium]